MTHLIDQKSTTIARLRKLLFGAETEKTAAVTGGHTESPLTDSDGQPGSPSGGESSDSKAPPEKPKGHGRKGANDYPGARRVTVPHATLVRMTSIPNSLRLLRIPGGSGRLVESARSRMSYRR